MNANVAERLWRIAEVRSEHPAIVTRASEMSYIALRRRAADYAQAFLSAGLTPGGRVAVLLERGADAAAAFFGAVAAGGVAIMVNEALRSRQIEYILCHAGASVLVTAADVLARLSRVPEARGRLVFSEEIEAGRDFEPLPRLDHDVASLVYTSGSTGMPKGVTVSHGNLRAGAEAVVSYLGIDGSDRIISLLPFSFDYGFNQLLCALFTGSTLVVERSPLPAAIVDTLLSRRVTVLAAVPPLWLQILETPRFRQAPLPDLRVMTNTGGHLPTSAVRTLRAAQPHARLFLMYGLTEAFRATYLDPSELDRRPSSIGKAIPGSEVMVLREDLTPCGPGEVGELVQRGPTVTLGYWNDPVATDRVFRPNPLRPAGAPTAERVVFSGDLVSLDDEGFLFFLGRRDRLIKTLGYRVSPDEVADAVHASGFVRECAITTEPDEILGSRIVAHVVLRPGADLASLTSYGRRDIPSYMRPARYHVHEELPRTSSGKQDVRRLEGAAVS